MSKQYKPNIVRGGIAVPLGNNYFFMKGRKHKQGGIDVGKDLEVEDGEVMKLTKDNIKVFSAVPFLNGQSPVEKLLGGEDPNKVFAQQERFKKVNKINDDGTKAQLGKDLSNEKVSTKELLTDIVKLADPTGVTSYGDVYNAFKKVKNNFNESNLNSLAFEILGALPAIGKIGKLAKVPELITKLGQSGKILNKAPKVIGDGAVLLDDGETIKNVAYDFARKSGGDAGITAIPNYFLHSKRYDPYYTGIYNPSRKINGNVFVSNDNKADVLRLSLFGDTTGFEPYKGDKISYINSNGEQINYNNKHYKYKIYPKDTLNINKNKKDIINKNANDIFRVSSDNLINTNIDANMIDVGKGNGVVKNNKVKFFDKWDQSGFLGRIMNFISRPTDKYPNSGTPIFIHEVPIKYNDTTDKEFIEFLDTDNKTSNIIKNNLKEKQMGGNHKLNTNQMTNIYRVDSNGKTTWGMNFSTGGKSKGRQKALYGMKQRKVNWSDPSPEDYRTMVATNPPIEMIYDPSVDETQYYGRDLPEVSVTRDIRVAPTNTSVDEMDVNRTITRKAKQPRKYYKSVVDPNIDPLNPTKDDYHYMTYSKRNDKDNVKPGPTFNNTVDARDVNREIPKTYVSTKSNSTKSTSPKLRRKYWDNLSTYEDRPDNQVKSNKTNVVTPNTIKSTTNNKSVNYSVTNKKQTTSKQTTSNTSATKTTPKSNVTNNTSNITTPNNVTRTAPIAKSTSQETPIFGLDAQNAFKKSIVGSKSNPDYIRGTFDFRDNKELVNKVDPNTIKVDSTNIRYKGAPSNGNYFKNYNAGDYISLGANVLGNIGSALINKHTLDNMEYASAPVPKMAIKQKTNFNINPQLDLSRERLREGVSDINTNTASSSTALNRNNKLRLANIMNTNQLYGTKENMETQLINADRMNQQNVFNSNIDAFNTWNKEKNIFETAKQEKYGENKVGAVQGISQAVHDFINNNEKRRQFNNSLISIMAANPNVNPKYLKTLGADWITNEHIRNWKLANNYKI